MNAFDECNIFVFFHCRENDDGEIEHGDPHIVSITIEEWSQWFNAAILHPWGGQLDTFGKIWIINTKGMP